MFHFFYDLPPEIIRYIYQYDNTYHIIYKSCLNEYNQYFKSYNKKVFVYAFIDNSLPLNDEQQYSKMVLKYQYIEDRNISDFVKYILN